MFKIRMIGVFAVALGLPLGLPAAASAADMAAHGNGTLHAFSAPGATALSDAEMSGLRGGNLFGSLLTNLVNALGTGNTVAITTDSTSDDIIGALPEDFRPTLIDTGDPAQLMVVLPGLTIDAFATTTGMGTIPSFAPIMTMISEIRMLSISHSRSVSFGN